MRIQYNKKKINTIYVFTIIFYSSILYIIKNFMGIDGVLSILIISLIVMINILGEVEYTLKNIGGIAILGIIILVNILFQHNNNKFIYLYYLLAYVITGFIGGACVIEYKRLYKYGAIYSVVWIIFNFINNFEYASTDKFAFGFMMLPFIYMTYAHMKYIEKMKKFWGVIFIILNIIMLQYSGRGAIVNLALFYIVILILDKKIKAKVISIILVGSIIFTITNPIIVSGLLKNTIGIEVSALEKTKYLLQVDSDITNGRNELYSNVINDTKGLKIIYGNGIGEYEFKNNTYTHNIILSIFYEFGIIGIIIFLIALKKYCEQYIGSGKEIYYVIILSLGMGILLFSKNYWEHMIFWTMISLSLKSYYSRKIVLKGRKKW